MKIIYKWGFEWKNQSPYKHLCIYIHKLNMNISLNIDKTCKIEYERHINMSMCAFQIYIHAISIYGIIHLPFPSHKGPWASAATTSDQAKKQV